MDALTDAAGTAFALLYVFSPLLFVAACGLLALVGLSAVAMLGVSLARRRWRAAMAAALVVAFTATPSAYVVGVADGLAWPGRYAPLDAADVAGTYARPPADLTIHLSPEGGFVVEGADWALPWRAGTWRVAVADDWGPAHHAGQVVFTDPAGAVVGALSVNRPLALRLGKAELSQAAHTRLSDLQRAEGAYAGGTLAFPRVR